MSMTTVSDAANQQKSGFLGNLAVLSAVGLFVLVMCTAEFSIAPDVRLIQFGNGTVTDVGRWFVIGTGEAMHMPEALSGRFIIRQSSRWDHHEVEIDLGYTVKDPQKFFALHPPTSDDLDTPFNEGEAMYHATRAVERALKEAVIQIANENAQTILAQCGAPGGNIFYPLSSDVRAAYKTVLATYGVELHGGRCHVGL